jgi:hypothetical protein
LAEGRFERAEAEENLRNGFPSSRSARDRAAELQRFLIILITTDASNASMNTGAVSRYDEALSS